jgi:hypothetical protein
VAQIVRLDAMALSHTPPCVILRMIKLVLVESLCCWFLHRKLVLHTMSYRETHMVHVVYQYDQVLRVPPPTPPELDPQAREPDDNTIVEFGENHLTTTQRQKLLEQCAASIRLPSKPVPSPKWDSVPMLPARVRRIVYMYCWGPPDVVDMQLYLGLPRGFQDWSYEFFDRPDNRPRGWRPDWHKSFRPDDDDIDDSDSTAESSFVGTDDGWDAGVEPAILPMPDGWCRRNLHKGLRRIVNAKIIRIEPRP